MTQLALFANPADGAVVCPHCGTVSPNQYLHTINHGDLHRGDYCIAQYGVINHIAYARQHGDQAMLAERIERAHQLGLGPDDYNA